MPRLVSVALFAAALLAMSSVALASSGGAVNGGGNWPWAFNTDGGTNYLQVNAKFDKDGAATGEIHWRQTRNGDQNYTNLVADVTCLEIDGNTAYLAGTAADGTHVHATVVDNGEPGADDQASITTTSGGGPCGDNTNVAPKLIENGNFQVRGGAR